MKIVAFEIQPREVSSFERLRAEHEVVLLDEPLRAANSKQFRDAEVICPFLYSELSAHVLQDMPQIKMIATRSTGYDHINLKYCKEKGIVVSNVPSYGEATVAEHVFALLLTISHNLREAIDRARNGEFSPIGLEGFDLAGKTLGVIGVGSIGRHVVRIARGFEMNVIAFDLKPDARLAAELGFRYMPLNAVFEQADILTLHVPAMPVTNNMISTGEFARMKDGVVLINTARGSLIEPRALIQALHSRKVAAAGLDVMPDEPMIREEAELICSFFCERHDLRNLVADHILLRMSNVVITPHSAFNTVEAMGRILKTTIANIEAFAAGTAQNVVN
ncbi:hydroxyacid dehydrogenase [Methylocystis echinoides]|uniref:Lactate dehydrogenase n=1 Tax=Methylocystis echinoides TaxID=29468 RepID=A0A9W6GZF5_9HYPH|nr:hydroxyacid dehydrogenase [Methylocystis echinoides]GLI95822.1 lactate dehydrogenase [Methylocystis echinoides]